MKRVATIAALLILFVAAPVRGEVVARCGAGWLERIDSYPVLHLEGTPWEMGWQHGKLLHKECRSLLHHLFDVKQHEASIRVLGSTFTPRDALSLIYWIQKRHIPPRYLEEMRGLAAALEVDEEVVFHANLIPELFHCSGFALLSPVTESGTLLHGRVLDYGTDWRLQEHAVLIVARPKGRIPFVNVTYAGFIGSVTGMNERRISIGEMGGRGLGKWGGVPMSFLVRRVLEEANSLEEGIEVFRKSRRTCEYYYILADAKSDEAVGMEAGADRFRLVLPGEIHSRLDRPVPHTVLLSAGSRYRELSRRVGRVVSRGGKFAIKQAIRLMDAPVAMRSNLHNVLMAPGLMKLWVANASPEGKPAWTRRYRFFDLRELLSKEPTKDSPR